ncbi:MAG: phosphate acyltransferase PlsX [Vampirovibrionales bacterium]|nr:phosphate acyltransferase PlsX [Vampirovibrionales bacterium]
MADVPTSSPKASSLCIAVDAMGGDHAPRETVKGAVLAAREYGVKILLVGKPEAIQAELDKQDVSGLKLEIQAASEVVGMDEAAEAVRKKKDASVVVAARCVKEGRAQAVVAAGSTGAAMAAAVLNIGRIPGVTRPAIGVTLPSIAHRCLLIDAGANADCDPAWLCEFARMGSVYMESIYNIKKAKVGLLNIGEEEGKGNEFVKAAYPLLSADHAINFVGNTEGRDLFNGSISVAVCDGFTGNVALKSAEGIMRMFKGTLKTELKRTMMAQLGAGLAKPALEQAAKQVDPEEFGGAVLFGLQGLCIISHGGSKARGIKNAVRVAKEALENDVLVKIAENIKADPAVTPVP